MAAGYNGAALPLWEAFARRCTASPAVADLVRAFRVLLLKLSLLPHPGGSATDSSSLAWLACMALRPSAAVKGSGRD